MWDPVTIFALQVPMSPSSLSSFEHNFCPRVVKGQQGGGGYLFCGFPLLLPAQVPGGCALWWLTAINSSSREYQCQGAHLGGRCWWHVLLCGCSLFPFWRERWEEEESAHWVSRDPAGAKVGRWRVDKLWGSVHWVMKWRFKTGENVKSQPGIDIAINSPNLMFRWVTALWLDCLMEHAGGEMMLWGVESPSSKDFLLSTVNFLSKWDRKT